MACTKECEPRTVFLERQRDDSARNSIDQRAISIHHGRYLTGGTVKSDLNMAGQGELLLGSGVSSRQVLALNWFEQNSRIDPAAALAHVRAERALHRGAGPQSPSSMALCRLDERTLEFAPADGPMGLRSL